MPKKGKRGNSFEEDLNKQTESEDYYLRHKHEERPLDKIRALNANMEAMRKPEEPIQEVQSPREQFRQKRHQIVTDKDIGM